MRVVCVIQARMGSTRLPGKVLLDLVGRAMLERVIARARRIPSVAEVVIATSALEADDAIAERAPGFGAKVTRGSESDVLARYAQAAREHDADAILRVTSDCPLLDPGVCEQVVQGFLAGEVDYASNTLERTWPRGLDAEAFSRDALDRADREADQPHEREHVTPYLYQGRGGFRVRAVTGAIDESGHRWTVDTEDDLRFAREALKLVGGRDDVPWTDLLAAVRAHPEVRALNEHVRQKDLKGVSAPRLLVRADASAAIGTGHVMRCLALLQAWRDAGGEGTLASVSLGDALAERMRADGIETVSVEAERGSASDAEATLALARERGAEWVVLDGYAFGPDHQRAVREGGARVLVIDDHAHHPAYAADAILNQNLGADAAWYEGGAETRLLGPRYALLRREFRRGPALERRAPARARTLLVTLGGGDPDDATSRVVGALERIPDADRPEARILCGAANPHRERLDARVAKLRGARLLVDARDMPGLMAWADLAVSAAGSTTWELCRFGVPALLVIVADNQRGIASALDAAGAARSLGWHEGLSSEKIAEALAALLRDPDARGAMAAAGRALVDGRGAERVARFLRGEP